jgi:hypothetical protein
MNKVEQFLAVVGAIKVLATALAPLFPVGSKPARFLNWIGMQLKGLGKEE